MGTRDVDAFRAAGRTLFSLGLVKGAEGNLSICDGDRLTITRAGARLADLRHTDVLDGTLGVPPADASSDLVLHVAWYRERGPGAIAHAHPEGTTDEESGGPGEHGVYAFAATLADAVHQVVEEARRP